MLALFGVSVQTGNASFHIQLPAVNCSIVISCIDAHWDRSADRSLSRSPAATTPNRSPSGVGRRWSSESRGATCPRSSQQAWPDTCAVQIDAHGDERFSGKSDHLLNLSSTARKRMISASLDADHRVPRHFDMDRARTPSWSLTPLICGFSFRLARAATVTGRNAAHDSISSPRSNVRRLYPGCEV
jgi:hypothetical protein